MRKDLALTAMALAGTLTFAPCAPGEEGGRKQGAELVPQGGRGKSQTGSRELSAADEFKGMKVQDLQGRQIGEVNGLIVDPGEGRMAYVMVSTEEVGNGQLIVPWSAMQMQQRPRQDRPAGSPQESERVLVLNIPREQLKQAPRVGMDTVFDREQGRRIHQFYGVSPYWEEGETDEQRPQSAPPLPPGQPPVLPPGHPPVLPPDHPPVSPPQQ